MVEYRYKLINFLKFAIKVITQRLKFEDSLSEEVVTGRKRTTWRVGDEKGLAPSQELHLIHARTGRLFAIGNITDVRLRTFGTLQSEDIEHHEPFSYQESMLDTYRGYYPESEISLCTPVTVVDFMLRLYCNYPGSDETDVVVLHQEGVA